MKGYLPPRSKRKRSIHVVIICRSSFLIIPFFFPVMYEARFPDFRMKKGPKCWNLFTYLFILATPRGMQDRSSPDQGSNLCPLQWQCGFLITGPPGKSLTFILDLNGIKLSILGWQMSPNQFHFS